jgi:molecular chaperone DnaK (HSP70)
MSKPVNGSLFRRGTTVDKKIVIAIDFGTSRTGYAFALKENKKVADVGVNVQLTWPDMYEKYCKTVTQLLYDPSDKCIAWGYSAIKRMTELTDELEERSLGYVVVKYFKMALRDPNGVFRDPTTGRQFKVVDMITEYLSRLYAQIMSDVTEVTKKTFKREEISWCLTVPAIWEDAQKEAMKVAAFRAKMIESVDVSDDDFLLVLEPEAAGVWCKVLQEANNDGFADGETFLVIDAGGGTIDLTAHEVAKGGLLREITRGSGNDLGSSKLDVKFWELLESSFGGKQNIESFKREYPFAVRELVGEWEKCKCNIDALSKTIYMRLPLDMVDWFQELEGTNINKRIVDVKSGRLKLDASELSKIYSEIVSSITTIVENQFAEYKKSSRKSFDYLCLVGGFGGSKVLQTALKSTFEDTKRVKKLIVPHSPGSAIVSGAVLLGYDHNLIKTRRMRTTYGIQTMVPYDTGKHKVSKKKVVQGKEYCDGYFKKFVVSGQEVEVGMKATEVLKAASPTQTSMLVGVYCHPFEPTTTSPLDYIDDRGVKKIGEIIVDLTRTVGVPNRQVQISMVFGKSEVLLEVTALNTSDRYEAKIKFEGNKLAEYTGPKYTPPPEVLYHQ